MGHKHYKLMLEFAKIAEHNKEPWKFFQRQTYSGWIDCNGPPRWDERTLFRLKCDKGGKK